MTILTQEEVAAIKAEAEKATPGPWQVSIIKRQFKLALNEDAAFIAHSRTNIPALCETVEALRAENERLRKAYLKPADPMAQGTEPK